MALSTTGAPVLDAQHVQQHRIAADAAWNAAVEFTAWWNSHPEHHRSTGRAA